ncbi:MAG: hypothetical protein ABI267_03240 [Ginsengibacter sp.]
MALTSFIFSLNRVVNSSMSSSLSAGSTVSNNDPKTLKTKGDCKVSKFPLSKNGSLIEKLMEESV